MKKFVLISLFITFGMTLSAQEKGSMRYGWDVGLTLPNGGGGVSGSGDVRYCILDTWNIGLRYGATFMIKPISNNDARNSSSDCYLTNDSYMLISDYYLTNGHSSFAPFVGAGLGVYNYDYFLLNDVSSTLGSLVKIGGLVRLGFEWEGIRVGLEYCLVPNTQLTNASGTVVGSSFNNYTNLTIGYFYRLW